MQGPWPRSYSPRPEARPEVARILLVDDEPKMVMLLESSLQARGHETVGLNDGQSALDRLDTDAGGDYDEENGVCYLQILLADEIPGFGRARSPPRRIPRSRAARRRRRAARRWR